MIKIHHHLDYEFLMFIIGTTSAAQCPRVFRGTTNVK
jgi:hypothetical protein